MHRVFTKSSTADHSLRICLAMEMSASRDLLKIELADRIAANPAYSLRAMARQTKISPSMLSALLSGKKRISPDRAFEIAKTLKFDKKKRDYFLALVQLERAKSIEQKAEILEKLHTLIPQPQAAILDLDLFRSIAEWYHLAILELTNTKDFRLTAAAAASALGITKIEAEAAIERLQRLELLQLDPHGSFRKSVSLLVAHSSTPHGALRKYHEQMLEKAKASLHTQKPNEKFVGSETFAFNEKDLEKASEIMEECFSRLVNLAGAQKDKKNVYHLGIQFFRLTKGNL